MLSSSHTDAIGNLLTSSHHYTSIAQPTARRESFVDTRHNSCNDPPSSMRVVHRTGHHQHVPSNASVHHGQQRLRRILNENVNPNEHSHHQCSRLPDHNAGPYGQQPHYPVLKTHKNDHAGSSMQQYRLTNELIREILPNMQTMARKPNPSLSKPTVPATRLQPVTSTNHPPHPEPSKGRQQPPILPPPSRRRIQPQTLRADATPANAQPFFTEQTTTKTSAGSSILPTQPIKNRTSVHSGQKSSKKKCTPEPAPIDTFQQDKRLPGTLRSFYMITKENKDARHPPKPTAVVPGTSTAVVQPAARNSQNKARANTDSNVKPHPKNVTPPTLTHTNPSSPKSTMADLLSTVQIHPTRPKNPHREHTFTRPTPSPKKRRIEPSPPLPMRPPSIAAPSLKHQIHLEKCHFSKPSSSSSSACQKSTDRQTNLTYRLSNASGKHISHANLPVSATNSASPPPPLPTTTTTFVGTRTADIVSHVPSSVHSSHPLIDRHASTSSSDEEFVPIERIPFTIGKLTLSVGDDVDFFANLDTDDGWSDDSIEIIYIDEHYITQKKKIIAASSSSSHYLFSPHAHLRTQQTDILLQ